MSALQKPKLPFDVLPMTGSIGAEITGIDLREPLAPPVRNALLETFYKYQVIVLRDQPLSPDQHMMFSGIFGPCMDLPHIPRVPGYDLLHQVRREPDVTNRRVPGENWHADSTFLPSPPKAVVMRAVDVPAFGGDTVFTSMYAAYEALSDKLKTLLSQLKGVHSATKVFGRQSVKKEPLLQLREGLTIDEGDKETFHPVICSHHEGKRKHLFVNLTYTQRFDGMTVEESKPLLEYLCGVATRPEFGCRVRWQNDTVVVWDNRSSMHRAVPDFLESFRYLQRTTIAGEAPHA
jgi:alpha-ketoglutarate-dependent taurine dioxygenase